MISPFSLPVGGRALRTAGALLLVSGLLPAPDALAQGPSLMQRLRELLGVQRPLAVAGSRSPGLQQGLCVVSPWPATSGQAKPTAVTPSGSPPIATSSDLAELQIHRDGVLAHRLRASSTQPIRTPLAWPISPISPGSSVELVLRPMGSSDTVQIRVRRPLPAERVAGLAEASAMEQLLEAALTGDPAQRRDAHVLISRSCQS